MRRLIISAVILSLYGAGAMPAMAIAAPAAPAARALPTTQLPRTVKPTHYDIVLTPDAASMTFSAVTTISIDVVQPTDSITLNAIGMTFAGAALAGKNTDFKAPDVSIDAKAQTATFKFDKLIAKGSYRLTLDYKGKIGTQPSGLFAVDYETANGSKRALFTQFENSDARNMVPSWDEPAYKATFTLSAVVPSALTAVSNMPAAKTTALANGLTRVDFPASPKMSSYLLFFGMGEFDRATKQEGKTELGVITKKGSTDQAAYALASSAEILREYNDYFATPFPLPKLDNIAAPGTSQFFSAMENWGAIFTFEHTLLLDPKISTQSDKQRVFSVAAHEMAHQWFGDLVTMAWWDDIWLNEGFASWMEARTTAKLRPQWNTKLSAVGSRESAMGQDANVTTHPVVQHIETVEQASQAFDGITYQKGQAVIGMLEAYVGPDAWRAGVRAYMKQHAYGNTVSDDLWSAIEKAAKKPVRAIAHDFTLQPGVPMITVGEPVCSNGRTTVTLTQGEFSKDQPNKKPLSWQVPVIAQTLGGAPVRALVTGGKATMTLPGCGPLVVNAGQSAYFRTVYSPKNFAAIAKDINTVPAIDQLGIMADSWSLGLAGNQPVTDFLDLSRNIGLTAEPQVWAKVVGVFNAIDGYYKGDAVRQARWRQFAIGRLAPKLAQLGWTAKADELDPVAILRTQLIATLGELGEPGVLAEARRRFAAQKTDPAAMPAALRRTIIAVVAANADQATWDQLHADALAEKTPLIRDGLFTSLASSNDPKLAADALALALTTEPGATKSSGMISRVAGSHPDLAFDFAMKNMAAVNAKVDASSRSRYFAGLAGGSSDPAMIEKLRAYATANLAPTSRRSTDTAIAGITYRIKVRSERLPQIDAWLTANSAK